jgi:hypothetical protein
MSLEAGITGSITCHYIHKSPGVFPSCFTYCDDADLHVAHVNVRDVASRKYVWGPVEVVFIDPCGYAIIGIFDQT